MHRFLLFPCVHLWDFHLAWNQVLKSPILCVSSSLSAVSLPTPYLSVMIRQWNPYHLEMDLSNDSSRLVTDPCTMCQAPCKMVALISFLEQPHEEGQEAGHSKVTGLHWTSSGWEWEPGFALSSVWPPAALECWWFWLLLLSVLLANFMHILIWTW